MSRLPEKVMQRSHDDCMRACLATYFRVPIDETPVLDSDDWDEHLREWLHPRGLGFFSATVTPDALRRVCGDSMVIVAGMSPRGVRHAVIYLNGRLWHDPHPEGGDVTVECVDVFFPLMPRGAQ